MLTGLTMGLLDMTRDELSKTLNDGDVSKEEILELLDSVSTPRTLPNRLVKQGLAIAYPSFLPAPSAETLMNSLLPKIPTISPRTRNGSPSKQRFTWFSDSGVSYGWSSQKGETLLEPCPVPEEMGVIMRRMAVSFGHKFNGCLVVVYNKGGDTLGFHQDREAANDPSAPVVNLSLGVKRTIEFRDSPNKSLKNLSGVVEMNSGDVLLFTSECKSKLWHGVRERNTV